MHNRRNRQVKMRQLFFYSSLPQNPQSSPIRCIRNMIGHAPTYFVSIINIEGINSRGILAHIFHCFNGRPGSNCATAVCFFVLTGFFYLLSMWCILMVYLNMYEKSLPPSVKKGGAKAYYVFRKPSQNNCKGGWSPWTRSWSQDICNIFARATIIHRKNLQKSWA